MHAFGKDAGAKAEQKSRKCHLCQRDQIDMQPSGAMSGGQKGDGILGMRHAPGLHRPIRDKGREQGGQKGVILHATDGQHLQRKDRTCQRCAEYGAEPRRNPGHQQNAQPSRIQPEQPGKALAAIAPPI